MKRYSAIFVLLLVLTMSEPVLAADLAGFYVAPKFFWSYQNNDEAKVDSTLWTAGYNSNSAKDKGGDAWGGALAVGYDFKTRFGVPVRTELEYALRSQSKTSTRAMDTSPVGSGLNDYYDLTRKLSISSLFANVYYDINTGTAFTPYVGGGIGVAFIEAKDHIMDGYYGAFGVGGSRTRKVSNFAWNLGAGVAYSYDSHWSFDLGYRYSDFGSVQGGTAIYPPAIRFKAKSDVTSHEVMLGARYTF